MEQKKKRRFRFRRRFKRRRVDFKKGLFLIPHFFTFANGFCGFMSIFFAATGRLPHACYAVLLGALMDMLDGRAARLLGKTSEFGVQLDSLSDLISFCLAPAFIVYIYRFSDMGYFGLVLSFFFLAAGMARLARFNIIHQQQTIFFLGMPTTLAGCFLVTLILSTLPELLISKGAMAFVVITLGLLMVSSVPFPTFKRRVSMHMSYWYLAGLAVVLSACFLLSITRVMLLVFLAYSIYAVIEIWCRRRKKRRASRSAVA